MAARIGILSYWAAIAAATYAFLSSAFCIAIVLGLVQGERTDAELTALFCAVMGFALLMCGRALRVLLTDR